MNGLYLLVKDQFPDFVQADYPAFIEFVQAYYKWMSALNPDTIQRLLDLDTTQEEFVQYFRKQYDVYGITRPASPFSLRYLTNIKEFYTTKGSEQGLVTALRALSNIDSSIEYPSENILRPSDGRWSQEAFILFTLAVGDLPQQVERIFVSINDTQLEVELSRYERITSTTARMYFKKSKLWPATTNQIITIRDATGEAICAGLVTPTLSSLAIAAPGQDWQLGKVIVIPAVGRNTVARVAKIDAVGAVQRLEVIEFGFPHTENSTFTSYPKPTTPTPESALTVELKFGPSVSLIGRWLDESGQVSNEAIRLQDSFYYQQFSYVINATSPLADYYDTAAAFHVSGTKAFAIYNLTTSIDTVITGVTEFPFLEFQLGPDLFAVPDVISIEVERSIESLYTLFDESYFEYDSRPTSSVTATESAVAEVIKNPSSAFSILDAEITQSVDLIKSSEVVLFEDDTKLVDKYLEPSIAVLSDGDTIQYFPPVPYALEDYFAEQYTAGNESNLIIGD